MAAAVVFEAADFVGGGVGEDVEVGGGGLVPFGADLADEVVSPDGDLPGDLAAFAFEFLAASLAGEVESPWVWFLGVSGAGGGQSG